MKQKLTILGILISLVLLATACEVKNMDKGSEEYINSIKKFRKERIDNLKTKSIWLKLAGLFWLEEGENKFGSDKNNDLIFPEGFASEMGTFVREDGKVKLIVKEGIEIKVNDKPVSETELVSDLSENPTIMKYKDFWWYIIKRGSDKIGIRLIDDKHSNLKSFKGIPAYSINEEWKIKAKWVPYNPVRTIETPSVIGTSTVDSLYGAILFTKNGKEYKLHAPGKNKMMFIVFADETSGSETYGAGRFLVAEADFEKNEVILDFNKAYNPPCSMSKFATCPLPPEGNRLKLAVTAGEKFEGHH